MNFLKNITVGQYVPGKSFLHTLDPRTKIVLISLFVIQCFIISNWNMLFIPFAFIILCSLLSSISIKYILRGLKPILPFVLITLFFNSFLTSGSPMVSYTFPSTLTFHSKTSYDKKTDTKKTPDTPKTPSINITYEGIAFGLLMSLRLLIIVLATSLFTLTTSSIEITDGIESLMKWGKYIKLPVHEIAMMMSIALRFIPTLTEHLDKIVKAQMSRGADFEAKSLIERAKCFIPVLIPLFVQAFKTADDLATAMEARCYRGGEGRTRVKALKTTWRDAVAYLVVIASFAGLITVQFHLL